MLMQSGHSFANRTRNSFCQSRERQQRLFIRQFHLDSLGHRVDVNDRLGITNAPRIVGNVAAKNVASAVCRKKRVTAREPIH